MVTPFRAVRRSEQRCVDAREGLAEVSSRSDAPSVYGNCPAAAWSVSNSAHGDAQLDVDDVVAQGGAVRKSGDVAIQNCSVFCCAAATGRRRRVPERSISKRSPFSAG
jgi:hypothetical protein